MANSDNIAVATDTLIDNWWAILLRGLCAVAFGIVTFIWPGLSLAALVLLYGVYALFDGGFAVASAWSSRGEPNTRRWPMLARGLFGLGAGIVAICWPAITALALLYVIAAWALVGGVLEVIAAVRLRHVIRGEWALALSGVLSFALGLALALFPAAGALALVLWVGAGAMAMGLALCVLAFRLRSWRSHAGPPELLAHAGAGSLRH
jgi:uncharacterized membrane protein HdeD (DUF308 family)